jgi:hypothetical protein
MGRTTRHALDPAATRSMQVPADPLAPTRGRARRPPRRVGAEPRESRRIVEIRHRLLLRRRTPLDPA